MGTIHPASCSDLTILSVTLFAISVCTMWPQGLSVLLLSRTKFLIDHTKHRKGGERKKCSGYFSPPVYRVSPDGFQKNEWTKILFFQRRFLNNRRKIHRQSRHARENSSGIQIHFVIRGYLLEPNETISLDTNTLGKKIKNRCGVTHT